MNFIIVILVLIFLGMLIFWKKFRDWLVEQLKAIYCVIRYYVPEVWRGSVSAMGFYVFIVALFAILSLILILVTLIFNVPGFTVFAFVSTLATLLLVWSPIGIVLKIFKINSTIVPQGLKVFVSWVAFLGFIGLLYPELISFKAIFAFALLWFILLGMTVKINVLDRIIFPLVVLMCLTFGWKYFFPDSFRSSTRYLSSWSKAVVTWKDRGSIRNEAMSAVTYGYPVRDIKVAYIADTWQAKEKSRKEKITDSIEKDSINLRDTNVFIARGTIIKVFNHKKEVKEFEGQGFIQIQLPREGNSFVKGKKCWVEADLIHLVTPTKLAEIEEAKRQFVIDSTNMARRRHLLDSLAVASRYRVRYAGTYEMNLAVGQVSEVWDSIPPGHAYGFAPSSQARFQVIYPDGMIINSWDPQQLPDKYRFKVKNLGAERPKLVVLT